MFNVPTGFIGRTGIFKNMKVKIVKHLLLLVDALRNNTGAKTYAPSVNIL